MQLYANAQLIEFCENPNYAWQPDVSVLVCVRLCECHGIVICINSNSQQWVHAWELTPGSCLDSFSDNHEFHRSYKWRWLYNKIFAVILWSFTVLCAAVTEECPWILDFISIDTNCIDEEYNLFTCSFLLPLYFMLVSFAVIDVKLWLRASKPMILPSSSALCLVFLMYKSAVWFKHYGQVHCISFQVSLDHVSLSCLDVQSVSQSPALQVDHELLTL